MTDLENIQALLRAKCYLTQRINQLEKSEELAWSLIANAYGGNWDLASIASGWKAAAERWRNNYYVTLKEGNPALETYLPSYEKEQS